MALMNTLRLLGKALPVIIANGPAIAEAVRQIRQATRKPKPVQPVPDGPALAPAAE
jgi:hypothetical protein